MATTLAKVALAAWSVFVVFVLSALVNSDLRIYWLWLGLGVVAVGFILVALRTGRRLAVSTILTASVFLVTYALYWIAISATIYGDEFGGIRRLENAVYIVLGNFQQGRIWLGVQSAYVQLVMPLIQGVVLVACVLTYCKPNRLVSK